MMGISGSYGAGLQQAMLSANSALLQAKVQSGVKGQLDGRIGVLKSELSQDGMTGGTSKTRQEELERAEKASEDLTKAQAGTLEKANQALQEAAKAQEQEKKEPSAADKTKEEKDSSLEEKTAGEAKEEKTEGTGSGLYTREGKPAGREETPSLSLRA